LGETFFEAKVRATVAALLLKRPAGGWVESVLTPALHFLFFFGISGEPLWLDARSEGAAPLAAVISREGLFLDRES
jgi:hypothetical protein